MSLVLEEITLYLCVLTSQKSMFYLYTKIIFCCEFGFLGLIVDNLTDKSLNVLIDN